MTSTPAQEYLDQTLDPESWEELRQLGHQMIDDLFNDLASLRDQPVWRPLLDEVYSELTASQPPLEPQGAPAAYADFRRLVAPYPRGNNHPRFWGWVNGSSLPLGILADLLASALNPSVSSFENAANLVEEQVLSWLKTMLGFPPTTSAVLTSGTSMSNLISLAVARHAKASGSLRQHGLSAQTARMTIYCSTETHSSVQKAVELLGLGSESLRRLPVRDDYSLDLDALRASIAHDRQAGFQPVALVANVGTVNTGAIDYLDPLADLCEQENLWLHVDGAFGALAWLCEELRPAIGALHRADSLAFDLHKWMYLPYDVGCVFVKDASAHRSTFATTASYLAANPHTHGVPVLSFPDYGLELSRRFRALKVWLCLKEQGVRRFEEQIRQNILQARYLAEQLQSRAELELCAPVTLNVVCFRFNAAGLSSEGLNALNLEILHRLQQEGMVFVSQTRLQARIVLRAAITNHRTRRQDLDLLVAEVVRLGGELVPDFCE